MLPGWLILLLGESNIYLVTSEVVLNMHLEIRHGNELLPQIRGATGQ